MNQPAAAVDPAVRRKRNRRVGIAIGVSLLVLAGFGVLVFVKVGDMFGDIAAKPWAELHRAVATLETPAGAEAFYKEHPGLAERFPTAEAFVAASRPWSPKLAKLPATFPGFWGVIKRGGNLNMNASNDRSTLTVTLEGVTVNLVTDHDQLVDMDVR